MKIGLVCPYSVDVPGGVQNQVLGLAGHLTRQGDQVSILAPGTLAEGRLHGHGLWAGQFTSAGPGFGIRYNGSIARVNPTPQASARVRRWLGREDLDLVHIHEPVSPSIGLPALRHARIPVVATFHTATPRSRALRLAAPLLDGCLDKITTAIAVSKTSREVVRTYYGRDPVIIPNGFRRAEFAGVDNGPGTEPGSADSDSRPRIAFLGRLNEPRKGLSVLLAALSQLHPHQTAVEVVIAGQGRPRLHLPHPSGRRRLVLARRRTDTASRIAATAAGGMSVQVAGALSDPERARLLASSDLFIAPHTDRESFGIVLVEAMAAGTTVVASDLAPFTDLLTGPAGPLGFSFPAGDASGLAATIAQALQTDRTAMQEQARNAAATFDWGVVGDRIRGVYRDVLAGRSGAGDCLRRRTGSGPEPSWPGFSRPRATDPWDRTGMQSGRR